MTRRATSCQAKAGEANLAKWKENRPEGNRLTHGAKSRTVRRKFTDLRTREAKDLARTIRELEDDLGPLSPGQRVILRNLAAKLAVTRAIAAWVDRQESVVVDGKLLPILAENFITYTGAIQRGVRELYDLAGKRPHRTVDLDSYIAGKKAAKQTEKQDGNGEGTA